MTSEEGGESVLLIFEDYIDNSSSSIHLAVSALGGGNSMLSCGAKRRRTVGYRWHVKLKRAFLEREAGT